MPRTKGKTMETDKGTQYTPRETEQRSYFLPPGLGDIFKDFCMGNASTGARGALILFMACRKFPDLRERAINAAKQMEIPAAVDTVEAELIQIIGRKLIEDYVESLPKAEKARIMAEILRKK